MTEEEWLATSDPHPMLHAIKPQLSERKLRLFGIACCRRVWHLLADERSRIAIERTECFADHGATLQEWNSVRLQAWSGQCEIHRVGTTQQYSAATAVRSVVAHPSSRDELFTNVFSVYSGFADAIEAGRQTTAHLAELRAQAAILRELFDPFRPTAFEPAWRISTAVALADAIYNDHAFDRLPILADALQDAGCEDADILGHCRGPGPHVRGCWVVDLVLGKN